MLGLQKRVGILKIGAHLAPAASPGVGPSAESRKDSDRRRSDGVFGRKRQGSGRRRPEAFKGQNILRQVRRDASFCGELNPDIVADALAKIFKIRRDALSPSYLEEARKTAAMLPPGTDVLRRLPAPRVLLEHPQRHCAGQPRRVRLRRHRLLFNGGAHAGQRLLDDADASFHGARHGLAGGFAKLAPFGFKNPF